MWIKGKHTFKFGYQYLQWRIVNNTAGGVGGNGASRFRSVPVRTGRNGNTNGVGGLAMATFFLGNASSVSVAAPLDLGYKESYHALFAQDDWKITRKLTINAGLRWDVAVPSSRRDSDSWLSSIRTFPTQVQPGAKALSSTSAQGPAGRAQTEQ